MIYRRMGKTDLQISLLSLGSGGHNGFGQTKGVPESAIHQLVHHALDMGVNPFDSSAPPGYGVAELSLGRALAGVPRDRYTLSTKFPIVDADTGEAISGARAVLYVENSLSNMKVDELDILLLAGDLKQEHYPGVIDALQPTLERLVREGKVRHVGSSEHSAVDGSHHWLSRALESDLIEVVMVAYNMMNQSAERVVFPVCIEKQIGTMGIFTVRNAFSKPGSLEDTIKRLKQRGLLDTTLVVFGTEFGRTPGTEGTTGRDHHPFGFSVWMAGGGVKGGVVHGSTDELGLRAMEDRHYITDVHATVLHQMGLDSRKLEVPGRKRLAIDHGSPIKQILS